MTQSIRSLAFVAITLFLGACGANPIQFAQCKLDTDADGNALKSSKDCEGGTSCQQFDGGEPGLQGMLCNDAANPCSTTSNAFKTCQDMGKICQVITLTDGSKGAKCVAEDPICANNGGCPSDTVCTPDGKGGKLCNTTTPAGTCSKQSDCVATQFCNIPVGKCEADHTVGGSCNGSVNPPPVLTPEMCTTNRCNQDARCGCNVDGDCGTSLVCDKTTFECKPDPAQGAQSWVRICTKVGRTNRLGARSIVFHNMDTVTKVYYTWSNPTANGQDACIDLTFGQVCGAASIALKSATYGPGGTATSILVPGAQGTRMSGVQLQICDGSDVTANCFAGREAGNIPYLEMTAGVTIAGLGKNPIGVTPKAFDASKAIFVQHNDTGIEGNPLVPPASIGCPQ